MFNIFETFLISIVLLIVRLPENLYFHLLVTILVNMPRKKSKGSPHKIHPCLGCKRSISQLDHHTPCQTFSISMQSPIPRITSMMLLNDFSLISDLIFLLYTLSLFCFRNTFCTCLVFLLLFSWFSPPLLCCSSTVFLFVLVLKLHISQQYFCSRPH